MSGRRMSLHSNTRKFGLMNRVGPGGAGIHPSDQGKDQDEGNFDHDFGLFLQINRGLAGGSHSFLKKRSATIHIRSTIKDIKEEDHRHQ